MPGGKAVLEAIERRVLYLARRTGAPQADLSLSSVLTALYFSYLEAPDLVALPRRAAALSSAVGELLGRGDEPAAYLDFAPATPTLGVAGPLAAGAARRYLETRWALPEPARFVAVAMADELDLADLASLLGEPALAATEQLRLVVALERGSTPPGALRRVLRSAGWHTTELHHGPARRAMFDGAGGKALRAWFEWTDGEGHQSLAGLAGEELRKRFLDGAPAKVCRAVAGIDDDELSALVDDLAGHELDALLEALARCDGAARPSALLVHTDAQRVAVGIAEPFPEYSAVGRWCAARRQLLARRSRATPAGPRTGAPPVPERSEAARPLVQVSSRWSATGSTADAFGRLVSQLARVPEIARRLVLVVPARPIPGRSSLPGGGAQEGHRDATPARVVGLAPVEAAGEIRLASGERHLAVLLGQLGLAWQRCGLDVLAIGSLPDDALHRHLDALAESLALGSRFVLAGLAEGPPLSQTIALALDCLTLLEPCFVGELDWLLCDALAGVTSGRPDAATYLRLSSRVVDQSPFEAARRRLGDERLRRLAVGGAYPLLDATPLAASGAPSVELLVAGSALPEVLEAAAVLAEEGVAADVIALTSLTRCARGGQLQALLRADAPLVGVCEGNGGAMAMIGARAGATLRCVGSAVRSGAGSRIDPEQVVTAALLALEERGR